MSVRHSSASSTLPSVAQTGSSARMWTTISRSPGVQARARRAGGRRGAGGAVVRQLDAVDRRRPTPRPRASSIGGDDGLGGDRASMPCWRIVSTSAAAGRPWSRLCVSHRPSCGAKRRRSGHARHTPAAAAGSGPRTLFKSVLLDRARAEPPRSAGRYTAFVKARCQSRRATFDPRLAGAILLRIPSPAISPPP